MMSPDHIEQSKGPQDEISKNWLMRSAATLFASKVIASAAVLLAGMLLLRYLDPAEYGFYQVIISISMFTTMVFGLGFSPVVSRFVPELLERGNSRAAAKFTVISFSIRVAMMAVLLPLGLLFFDSIERLFGLEEINGYGPVLTVSIVLGTYLGSSAGPVLLGAYARQVEIGLAAVVGAVLRILAIIFVIGQDYGLVGVLVGISIVEIAMMLGYLVRVFFVVSSRTNKTDLSSSSSLKGRVFRYSGPNSVMSAFSFFEGRFGMIFVISSSLGTAAVGNYAFVFAMLQFGAVINPIYTLNTLIDNVIVRKSVHVDQRVILARGQRMFLAMAAYTGIPVAFYLLLIREPLSQAFGFEQAGTGWLFLWAGIFFVANSMKLAYGNIFTQLEVPKYRILFGAMSMVGVAIAFGVIDRYGIVGVAGVAAATSSVVLLVQHWISRIKLNIPVGIYPVMLLKIFVINAIAGAATSTVIFTSDRFVPMALMTSVVFLLVYLVLTFVLRPFPDEDARLIRSILPNWVPESVKSAFS